MRTKQNELDIALFGSIETDTLHTFHYYFGMKTAITSRVPVLFFY